MTTEEQVLEASEDGDFHVAQQILSNHPMLDPSIKNNQLLGNAVRAGDVSFLEFLLRDARVDRCDRDFYAIESAIQMNRIDLLELLFSVNAPKAQIVDMAKCAWQSIRRWKRDDCARFLLSQPEFILREIGSECLVYTACSLQDILLLQELLKKYNWLDPSWNESQVLRDSAQLGLEAIVEFLLKDGRTLTAGQKETWKNACESGSVEIVRQLLKTPQFSLTDGAIQDGVVVAAVHGHLELVEFFLKNEDFSLDPGFGNNRLIREVCAATDDKNSLIDVVSYLLETFPGRVDPSAGENECIRSIADKGDSQILRVLLNDPRVDPCSHDNFVVRRTIERSIENQEFSNDTGCPGCHNHMTKKRYGSEIEILGPFLEPLFDDPRSTHAVTFLCDEYTRLFNLHYPSGTPQSFDSKKMWKRYCGWD